jgi:hypothetical protein
MPESFLEEQLKRIKRLVEEMTRAHDLAETSQAETRRRDVGQSDPLRNVRDVRVHESQITRQYAHPPSRPEVGREPVRRRRR